MKYKDSPGKSYPLGATVTRDGVNFVIYSKRADFLELLLFQSEDSPEPFASYYLLPESNRTANYWHIFLEGAGPNLVYAYRAHGLYEPWSGLRFDSGKVLLDPYSRAVVGWQNYSREKASRPGDNCATSLRSVVLDWDSYDWQNDHKPAVPYPQTVIYEVNVGGFTKNQNSGVSPEKRGTFAGIIEKIPYLKKLGVTTIELMPVQAFDKQDAPPGMFNYWGYSPVGFFAPHMAYSSQKTALGALNEFRDMVRALHANGMEVILDVVFNHTCENGDDGPTISFKGFDNLTYYTLDVQDYSYKNYSGCGNTLRSEHPIVGKMIVDSLRFWAHDMHVDGFRFDLASILSRDIFGSPLERPPLLWDIESDSVLASSKLIAEAWDSAGLYQVGWFITRGNRFAEWNGPFRDDVRRFVKGEKDSVVRLAQRLTGSSDIYGGGRSDTYRTIHFVTCHDGFTLNDLVSFNQKHNQPNGENNRDGLNENFSWNCGSEGATDSPAVERLRIKQMKNLLAILFLSHGTPMLCAGDEVRRTTGGNNNPYCQDNEINWFDWRLPEKNEELFRYTRQLIKLSRRLSPYRQGVIADKPESVKGANHALLATWHGVRLGQPDFSPDSHSLALELCQHNSDNRIYLAFNAYWEALTFQLPRSGQGKQAWHKVLDTAEYHPEDIIDLDQSPLLDKDTIRLESRSVLCLVSDGVLAAPERVDPVELSSVRRQGITWTAMKRPVFPS